MTTPPTPVYLTEAHRKSGQRRLVYKARGYDYFAREIRAAVRGYWSGALDDMSFYDAMYSTLRQGITAAWHEGAELCGIYPDELTIDERKRLQFRIVEQMNYVTGFADAIREGSKGSKGKLTPLLQRAGMWINRYNDVRNEAQMLACKNKKLMWIFGDTVHCRDCSRLHGRVYRASIWQKYDIRPQMHRLECRGFKCQCRFEQTNQRATPGHPPRI